MPRTFVIVGLGVTLAIVASGCGSKATTAGGTTQATATAPIVPGQPNGRGDAVCESVPHPGGLKANFGRRPSASAAEELRKQAETRGFVGLDVEERGCGNFYVTLPGLVSVKQFAAFKAEAKTAGFAVTLLCEPPPQSGHGTEAVFGFRRTHHLAVNLKRIVVHRGFVGADIEQDSCDHWSVFVPGITSTAMAKAFAAEARSAGFTVTFRPS